MPATQQVSHVYPVGSRLDANGVLEIAGCNTLDLAREFGTPVYVVAEDDVRARARAFLDAFAGTGADFAVYFASKAFPCTAVLSLLAQEGLGCDVASGGELALALHAGFDAQRIELHGNAKSLEELRAARRAGVRYVVIDSLTEIDRLEQVVEADGGDRQAVLIRVTPNVRGDTHDSISTGQADSKFGLGVEDARAAIARVQRSKRLVLDGLHMHIGSQLLELEPFRAAVAAIAQLGEFPVYNLGGGLGAAYTADQEPPSIEDYVAAKVSAVDELIGPGRRILDEPGRALVANAGVTLYTVESVKRNVSTWVAVDGGMSDNLRPMLYGARYEAQVVDRFGGGTRCRIVGKHCESGDVIASDVELEDPRPGDVIVTPATGAYGYSLANNYNAVLRAPVVFVKDGDARLVVRRDSLEDLWSRDV
jgi:diaminopimelate decarboxylase